MRQECFDASFLRPLRRLCSAPLCLSPCACLACARARARVAKRARRFVIRRLFRAYARVLSLQPCACSPCCALQLLTEVLENGPTLSFTGEEAEGRFLDMHELHE
eukprot:1351773-Pleurochrysis_carterae.AAC.1